MTSLKKEPLTVMILSGGTGRTADQVVAAGLAQFDTSYMATEEVAHEVASIVGK